MTNSFENAKTAGHAVWLAARRTDWPECRSICVRHGSPDGSYGGIPPLRLPAALIELQTLANANATAKTSTSTPPKPTTLDDIREDAFAKFNNPKIMQRNVI